MNIPALLLRTSFDADANGTPESIISNTYSASGNLLTSAVDSDANGQADTVTTYTYDSSGTQTGQVVNNIDNGNISTVSSFTSNYTVDDNGVATYTEIRLDLVNNTEGIRIYKFDSAGNFIEESTGTISENGTVEGAQVIATYAYNSSGQITVYETNGTRTEYTYDAAGRFSGSTMPSSSITYEYDEVGNLIRQASNSSSFGDSVTTFTYDESNRLVELSVSGSSPNSPFGGGFSFQVSYDYNAAGQVTSLVAQSNVSGRFSGSRNTYTYDEAGSLIKDFSEGTGRSSGISSETTYTYDAAGRVISYAIENKNSFGPTGETRYTYEYNEAGNLTRESFSQEDSNGLDDGRIAEYSYDDAGRITSFSIDVDADGTIDDVTSYEYDDLLASGAGSAAAIVSESGSAMEADVFFGETAQSVVVGTGDVFSSGELITSSLMESFVLLNTEASLAPTDQFSI